MSAAELGTLLMQKPILVLGSTGRVGWALRAVWPADVPVLWQTRHRADGLDTVTWDMLNAPPPALPELTGVVALAGVAAGPDLSQNTSLAIAAAALDAPILLASSQAIYGTPYGPASETTKPAPVTDYGHAKWAMERAIAQHPHVTRLRIGNVVGCDGVSLAMARGPVALDRFADGQGPRRMMITPDVLARVICTLLASPAPLPPVINIAQPGLVPMQDVLTDAGAAWHWRPAPANALAALEMDVTLLQQYVPDLSPWSPAG